MSIREEELRAVAAGGDETDIAVLADYYEQNGQPSRAAMWRDPARRGLALKSTSFVPLPSPGAGSDYLADYLVRVDRAKRSLQIPPDFIITPQGPTDPRRNAMIWLLMQPRIIAAWNDQLRKVVISQEMILDIANSFELSTSMIRHVITTQDRLIRESVTAERTAPTMRATQRLMAAGAIPTRRDDRARFVSYDRDPTRMTGITGVGGVVADAPAEPGAAVGTLVAARRVGEGRAVQQVGVAVDSTTMTIEFGDEGWTERELYLSGIELPPDTWPHTATIGIVGPHKFKIEMRPRKPLVHPHPIPDPVSDLPLFKRHGERKDTTPRGPRLPRPAKKRP